MLGAVINAFVIGVNGGVMPANATALRTAGIHPSLTEFANSAARPGAHLSFLGDVFGADRLRFRCTTCSASATS